MASKPRGESAPNEFDAAKSIVDILTGLEKAQQERVLRFASEALGLTSPSSFQTPASSTHIQSRSSVIATPTSVYRSSDIKQFAEMKSPKSDQQFAAVAAYYYKFEAAPEDRKETINAEVLANAARLAARRRPTRYALYNAQAQGYLDSLGGGEFKINTVGENLVALALGGEEESRKAVSRTRRKKKITRKRRSSPKKG